MSTKSSAKNVSEGKNEAAMDYNFRQDGNYIVVGDSWRMELPYGVRCRLNTSNEPEHKGELLFELDKRIFGSCFLDEALKKGQEAIRTAYIKIKSIGDPPKELINEYLRNDEIMSVQLVCQMNNTGKTTFEIIITEKERAAETRIVFIVDAELTEESIHNIQEHEFTLEHPLGSEWERYFKIVMRMASSISPLHETQREITLGPAEIIEGGFSVRLPSELKRIKPRMVKKLPIYQLQMNLHRKALIIGATTLIMFSRKRARSILSRKNSKRKQSLLREAVMGGCYVMRSGGAILEWVMLCCGSVYLQREVKRFI